MRETVHLLKASRGVELMPQGAKKIQTCYNRTFKNLIPCLVTEEMKRWLHQGKSSHNSVEAFLLCNVLSRIMTKIYNIILHVVLHAFQN